MLLPTCFGAGAGHPVDLRIHFSGEPQGDSLFCRADAGVRIGFSVLRIHNRLREIRWITGLLGSATLLKLVISDVFQGGGWTPSAYLTLLIICTTYFSLGTEALARYFDN